MGNRVIFSSLLFHDFIQQYISKMRIDSCTELIPLSIPGSQFLLTFFLVPKFCLSKNVCKIVMLKQREYQLTEIPCNQPHWRCPAHSRTCAEKRLGQHVTGFLRPYLYKTTLLLPCFMLPKGTVNPSLARLVLAKLLAQNRQGPEKAQNGSL